MGSSRVFLRLGFFSPSPALKIHHFSGEKNSLGMVGHPGIGEDGMDRGRRGGGKGRVIVRGHTILTHPYNIYTQYIGFFN